jgi:N-acetylglutamate synthase-like GNAT family acetyltransferase
MPELEIRVATEADVPEILRFIKELAEYERLSREASVTEETLRESLFGERRVAEVVLGCLGDDPAGFALFFHNFSTFLGKPGI